MTNHSREKLNGDILRSRRLFMICLVVKVCGNSIVLRAPTSRSTRKHNGKIFLELGSQKFYP